jgi:hypothetical protein
MVMTNKELKEVLLRNYTKDDLIDLWISEMSEDRKRKFREEDEFLRANKEDDED